MDGDGDNAMISQCDRLVHRDLRRAVCLLG
jgi:hypothetical protein